MFNTLDTVSIELFFFVLMKFKTFLFIEIVMLETDYVYCE